MEGIILKCPKGYIKKADCYYTVVPTKEYATMFFTEEHISELFIILYSSLNVKFGSIEKLKVKRTTTIIN